jgi:hypothetical protein
MGPANLADGTLCGKGTHILQMGPVVYVVQPDRRRVRSLRGYPSHGLVVLRTALACGDTFRAILIALEDWLAEFVALDGEFSCLADGGAQGPVPWTG